MICNTIKNIVKIDDLNDYFSSDLLDELYFKSKKVNKELISEKLHDLNYIEKFNNTIKAYKNVDIEKLISDKINEFEKDTLIKIDSYKIYVIIGLDTTTIYSIKYNDEDITVLLLESTNGDMDNLDMLLAHEFTHFVRSIVNKDTVEWVKNNLDKVESHMVGKLDTNELMSDYFYMFADTFKTGLPARTGYVYGYLIVKEYLEKNNLKIKDIIDKDWKDIL